MWPAGLLFTPSAHYTSYCTPCCRSSLFKLHLSRSQYSQNYSRREESSRTGSSLWSEWLPLLFIGHQRFRRWRAFMWSCVGLCSPRMTASPLTENPAVIQGKKEIGKPRDRLIRTTEGIFVHSHAHWLTFYSTVAFTDNYFEMLPSNV